MPKHLHKIFSLFLLLSSCFLQAQTGAWTQKANFPGGKRSHGTSFVINGKAYAGIGQIGGTLMYDWWEYTPGTDTWLQKANFPGTYPAYAVGFVIGNKGYVGTGRQQFTSSSSQNVWQYNPQNDTWAQKTNFPGTARYAAAGFSANNKGYITTGWDNLGWTKDIWEYDTLSNGWTQKTKLPAGARNASYGISSASSGYLLFGQDSVNAYNKELWQYKPVTDTWVQKTSLPSVGRYAPEGFLINGYLYAGLGQNGGSAIFYKDFWRYDTLLDTWQQVATFPAVGRTVTFSFSINNKGYIATGLSTVGQVNDVWEFDPNGVGVNEIYNSNFVNIFPNPCSDKLNIELSATEKIKNILLHNVIGETLEITFECKNSNTCEINAQSLAEGIYFIYIITDKETIIKKISKQ